MYGKIDEILSLLRQKRPLLLNITNDVTMDFVANGLLSLGASPLMTQSRNELSELINMAHGVVINIGTLNEPFIKLCENACQVASQSNVPLFFDPAGAGASHYRTQTSLSLLEQFKFTVLRANASEIMALCKTHKNRKGVDSALKTQDVVEHATKLAEKHGFVIAISGETDAVFDAKQKKLYEYGSPLMPQVTGTGCLLTAVIAAFNSVYQDAFLATAAAIVFYGLCGEKAANKAQGPGTFKPLFLDALSKSPMENEYAF